MRGHFLRFLTDASARHRIRQKKFSGKSVPFRSWALIRQRVSVKNTNRIFSATLKKLQATQFCIFCSNRDLNLKFRTIQDKNQNEHFSQKIIKDRAHTGHPKYVTD